MKSFSAILASSIGLSFLAFELIYRTRQNTVIYSQKKDSKWLLVKDEKDSKTYKSSLTFKNPNKKYEATLTDLKSEFETLFKNEHNSNLVVDLEVITEHEDMRKDGYIPSHIIKPSSELSVSFYLTFSGEVEKINEIHAISIKLNYGIYDRKGYKDDFTNLFFVPLTKIEQKAKHIKQGNITLIPVKTHLLSDSDNFSDVINEYAKPISKPGDIVVLAESPVAVTQERYIHPKKLDLGFWAKRLCYFVGSAGSLSSPSGMQCAINEIGLPKIMYSLAIGSVMKLLGKRGWFYTLAGIQSELIDDVTGTIPPFDKYIIWGPKDPENYVKQLKKDTELDIALADANDLNRARIISSTLDKETEKLVQENMRSNPAGNSSEQTPVVILRFDN